MQEAHFQIHQFGSRNTANLGPVRVGPELVAVEGLTGEEPRGECPAMPASRRHVATQGANALSVDDQGEEEQWLGLAVSPETLEVIGEGEGGLGGAHEGPSNGRGARVCGELVVEVAMQATVGPEEEAVTGVRTEKQLHGEQQW